MRILHLYDIHFGRNYARTKITDNFENKEKILNDLIDCIKNLESHLRPDHVVVTGDIAWWGKRDEYEEAYQWFSRLLSEVNLTGKDITFCPGNHDANRRYALSGLNINDETIDKIDELYQYENYHQANACFLEYDKFCERLGVEPFSYPLNGTKEYSYSVGWKDILRPHNKNIRLLGFNTALLSANSEISEDKTWIGLPQLKDLIAYGVIPKQNNFFSIALMHHAERFLHPNEVCEYDNRVATFPFLRKKVDLVLCGHTETGGKPVLNRQVGGGQLLTAGATYYNDEHPNSFSIIIIPDNEDEIIYAPFLYKNGWREYPPDSNEYDVKKIEDIPSDGETNEECFFVITAENEKIVIPLKRLSLTKYNIDGELYIKLDNRKDVLRALTIIYEGPISGGNPSISISVSKKRELDAEALLERDRTYHFINENTKNGKKICFTIENAVGQYICKAMVGSVPDLEVSEFDISCLESIVKIEQYYDVKFHHMSNDLYERDYSLICNLIQLKEKGYLEGNLANTIVDFSFEDITQVKKILYKSMFKNSFDLHYKSNFECELFNQKIMLDDVVIMFENYRLNRFDLIQKLLSMKKGDIRKCIFKSTNKTKHKFILLPKEFLGANCGNKTIVKVYQKMNINFDFFKERS